MKRIAVLVDFTKSGTPALHHARNIADLSGAEIIAVNVSDGQDSDEAAMVKLGDFVKSILGANTELRTIIGHGNIMTAVPEMLADVNPDLVVICTHGIHGIMQKLFGATILKLVQAIHYPSLVVQENSATEKTPQYKILFTASPFDSYETKLKQCGALAKAVNAEVIHYEIEKYLAETQEPIADHAMKVENYFRNENISFSKVTEENKTMSLGYAQQTLDFARANKVNFICLSSHTHQETMAFGKADKEKFLTNPEGIPLLCCNE